MMFIEKNLLIEWATHVCVGLRSCSYVLSVSVIERQIDTKLFSRITAKLTLSAIPELLLRQE